MKTHTKKLIKIVEWGMFGIILLLFAVIISPLLPTKDYVASYAVVSGSMEPVIQKGSIAFVRPTDTNKLQKGSVIAFTHPNNPKITVLHRVVEADNKTLTYQTKGDANDTADNWEVTSDQVIGTYTFSVPFIGYLADYIRQPIGFALLVGLPALLLLIMQIISIKQGIEQEVQKRVKAQSNNNFQLPKLLFLTGIMSIGLLQIPQIHSALVSAVTITGISLETKETFAEVSLTLQSNGKKVNIEAKNISGYSALEYELYYDTNTVRQGVIGSHEIGSDDEYSKVIILGTCSDSGCTYHSNPHNLELTITLEKGNSEKVTITKSL